MERNDLAELAALDQASGNAGAQASDPQAWAVLNQRWLAERCAWWCRQLAAVAGDVSRGDDPVGTAHPPPNSPPDTLPEILPDTAPGFTPAAYRVAASLGLSVFERELLVLAAGIEIDAALCKALALAQAQGLPEGQRARLGFATALALLPQPHWDALSPLGPLRQWSLLHFDTSRSIGQAGLRIDERVLYHLTGVAAFDDELVGLAVLHDDAAPSAPHHEPNPTTASTNSAETHTLRAVANALADPARHAVVLHTPAAQKAQALDLAAAAWAAHGLRCLHIDATALPSDANQLALLARRLQREAVLSNAGLCLVLLGVSTPSATSDARGAGGAAGASPAAWRLASALSGPLLVVGSPTAAELAALAPRHWLRFGMPEQQGSLLHNLKTEYPAALTLAAARAAQQFKVEPLVMAQALTQASQCPDAASAGQVLWASLRESARGGLDGLAQRIAAPTRFADLVLPPHAMAQLEAMASQLMWRHRVHEDWGFAAQGSRGLGLAALFAGDSGTGKTMAAEAIANAAQLDLYRVDLASTVSKYIGETEKNLSRLFDAAQASGAVLLFDEADALFGKRSEVKDSHDRYANIEVAYLLQRIESYGGLVILTTNLKSALDPAFLRRIRFVVQFPYPDEAGRAQIWQRQFPPQAPLGELDVPALAQLQLAGGHIRSVVLNAAFNAAARGGPIEQHDLLAAARAEFGKLERSFVEPRGRRP
jgi:ATPase family associated with various cellular activities (AAA)